MGTPSFDETRTDELGAWVIENGLPQIPNELGVGMAFPIARWVKNELAATLHVEWQWTAEHTSDHLISVAQIFRRSTEVWIQENGDGGSGWFAPPFTRPQWLQSRECKILGKFGMGEVRAIYGIAGSDAEYLEVSEFNVTTRSVIESEFGAFIAASDGDSDSTFYILDADAVRLASGSSSIG